MASDTLSSTHSSPLVWPTTPRSLSRSPSPIQWEPPPPRPSPPPASQIQHESLPFHRYDSLPPVSDAIRLVRLRPADLARKGLPVCKLETHFLDLHPPFCALSYSWSLPEDIEEIVGRDERLEELEAQHNGSKLNAVIVDGQMFGVRQNLFDFLALTAIRMTEPSWEGYDLFWIDAMCIDQHNLEERNEQVSMMSEIYQEAGRVLVWLGDDLREEMSDVKDMVYRILDMGKVLVTEANRLDLPGDETWETHIDQEQYLRDAGLPQIRDERWWRFCAFFRRSWFNRLWILQEVAVARQIVMICGEVEFEIIDLDRCAYLLRFGLDLQLGEQWMIDQKGNFRPIARNVHRVCQIMRWCQLNETPFQRGEGAWLCLSMNGTMDWSNPGAIWNALLDVCDSSRFSEPVDQFYALFGIVKHLTPQTVLPIRVDYSKHPVEVALEMWSYIIKQTEWLSPLCKVSHERLQINLPSWLPAFGETGGHRIYLHGRFNASLSFVDDTKYPDRKDPDLPMFRIVDRVKLLVAGVQVDRVSRVGSDYISLFVQKSEDIMGVVKGSEVKYKPTGESLARAIWKTTAAWTEDNEPSELANRVERSFQAAWLYNYTSALAAKALESLDFDAKFDLKESLHQLLADRFPNLKALNSQSQYPGLPYPDQIVDEVLNWDLPAEFRKERKFEGSGYRQSKLDDDHQEYRFLAGKMAATRRFFRTDSGYIGIGPDSLMVNDEIWLIPRTTVPLVLARTYMSEKDSESSSDERDGRHKEHKDPLLRTYLVKGECYVHGIMHGEFVKRSKAEAARAGEEWGWDRILIL